MRGHGSVPRYGPGSVLIHVPKVHQLINAVNKYLRTESSLPTKTPELALLVNSFDVDLPPDRTEPLMPV